MRGFPYGDDAFRFQRKRRLSVYGDKRRLFPHRKELYAHFFARIEHNGTRRKRKGVYRSENNRIEFRIGPPADAEYAVEPVGVLTMMPSVLKTPSGTPS